MPLKRTCLVEELPNVFLGNSENEFEFAVFPCDNEPIGCLKGAGEGAIEVTLVSEGEMFVAVDGTRGPEMGPGDQVRIRCAPHRTLILRNPEVDPFGLLRTKLRWGAR